MSARPHHLAHYNVSVLGESHLPMTIPVNAPLVSPLLVGRAAQVAAIERALEQARGGAGRVMLISGEAGIGKSRLMSEVRLSASQTGFEILEGHCFEPDRSLPYAPLLDLLRTRFSGRSEPDPERELGIAGQEIVKLLPELAALGRDPRSIRRSFLAGYTSSDEVAWESIDSVADLIGRYREVSFSEIIFPDPEDGELPIFERVATDLLPALRHAASIDPADAATGMGGRVAASR